MFKLIKNNLYLKFNLLIVGTIFICGLIMGLIFLYSTDQSLRKDLEESAYQTAEGLASSVSDDILLDNQFSLIEQIIQAKNQNPNIRYILITNNEQKILASTFFNGYPKGLPQTRDIEEDASPSKVIYTSNEANIDELIYPINGGRIGYIRIGMSELGMDNLIKDRSWQIFSMVFLVCIFGSGLATYYAWRILQPITEISNAVSQIGTNELPPTLNVSGDDEVGKLGKAFSKMVERLEKKNKENNFLLEALKDKEETRKWLISQLFTAREDECKRISRELHDESSQSMVSILAYLRLLKDKLNTKEQLELLENTRELTAMTLEGIRGLAVNLHPPLLEDLGLIIAMEKYLDTCRTINKDLSIEFKHQGDFDDLNDEIGIVCYRTLQEAMTNILRHAQATEVKVEILHLPKEIALIIKDNGVGFDEKTAEEARLDRHLGLVSMRERAELLNGAFQLESTIGKGTYLTIVLPLHK